MINSRQSSRRRFSSGPYANINWEKAVSLFAHVKDDNSTRKKFPSVRQILFTLVKAGADGIVFIFDSEKRGLKFMHPGVNIDSPLEWQIKQMIRQLCKQHFISVKKNTDGTTAVRILKKGMIKALTYQLDTMKLIQPKRWDNKWRVVIFDIPNKYARVRDLFRKRLRQLGLFGFQESVYISPYSCFNEIEFLRELYGVAFTVKYLLVERIEDDAPLKAYFHLV